MRKLFTALTSITLVTSASATIVGCTGTGYKNFENFINSNKTFVYYVSANDCADCKETVRKIWNNNKNVGGNQGGILNKDAYNFWLKQYGSPSANKTLAYDNITFYNYNVSKTSGAYTDSSMKKIEDWIVNDLITNHSGYYNKTLKWSKIASQMKGLPLFLYFSSSQTNKKSSYMGYSVGKFDDIKTFIRTLTNYMTPVTASNPLVKWGPENYGRIPPKK